MKDKNMKDKNTKEDVLEKELKDVKKAIKKECDNDQLFMIAELTVCVAAVLTIIIGIVELINDETTGLMNVALAVVWASLGFVFSSLRKKKNTTSNYYEEHAEEFVAATENADMSEARNKFLSYVVDGGLILDWGCGSGRDALAFKEDGYQVEATDASKEMCRLASEKTGISVKCIEFDQLDSKDKYNGIWACASLLHAPEYAHIEEYILRAQRALKPKGVLYMSFKYGDFEGYRDGRYFVDMTEKRMSTLLKGKKKIEMKEEWISQDVRGDREGQKWYNVIIQKK